MMDFEPIAEVLADPESTLVYEEGWQSWSPAGIHRASGSSPRPPDRLRQTMGWRPGKELSPTGFQGEGILAVAAAGEPVRVWYSPEPARAVASIRLEARSDRLFVSADGPVAELVFAGSVGEALEVLVDRLGPGAVASIPPGWCSWSFYFRDVTEEDVVENLEAAARLSLPVEIVQVDDGYQTGIGDWLHLDPHRTLAEWGFSYHKLDFLYAGAIDGRRRQNCSPLDAYLGGLQLIRRAAGPQAILLGCGAPLLPSIGLVDAMRIGPDVLPEAESEPNAANAPGIDNALRVTRARGWMHARLWANDPDCLVVRPEIRQREAWARHVAAYGGLSFSSDRLQELDERGLELTSGVLRPSSTKPIRPDTGGRDDDSHPGRD